MARIFLSHASADKPIVRRIAAKLSAEGHETWVDEERIVVGDSIVQGVSAGLHEADYVVLCLSRNADRGWVEAELDTTLMRQYRERKVRLLPVRLEEVEPPPLLTATAWVDVFPGEQEFQRGLTRLLHSITTHEARREGTLGVPMRPPMVLPHGGPHQLRAPPGDFTGRDSALAELLREFETGECTSLGLYGPGGVGKTAFALKLAEALAPRFPDGQIDLDLRGVAREGQTALSPVAVMAHVVRSFDPKAVLPEDEQAIAGVYRSTLHGKRVLLLLDNVGDCSQVESLVPPSGCCLILTSRQQFTLPGMCRRRVDALPSEDAERLLRRIAPRLDPAFASTLAELCGHLPLALRLSASTLSERVDLEPAEYVERLRTAPGRLKLVEASLGLSYGLADGYLQQCWRRLGVFPSDFDRDAAAVVAGISPDAARDALGELVHRSMLDYDVKAKRYRLHDLSRLYAVSRLADAERHAAEYRHAMYFEVVAAYIGDLHQKGGHSLVEGMKLLDREWVDIQAGQAWASSNSRDEKAVAELCIEYTEDGFRFLAKYLNVKELARWLEAGIQSARRLGWRRTESRFLISLGSIQGMYDKAQGVEQLLANVRESGDIFRMVREMLAPAVNVTARILAYLEQALIAAHDAGARDLEVQALLAMGMFVSVCGEQERALEYYTQAQVRARESGDSAIEVQALLGLSAGQLVSVEPELARASQERVLEIAREKGDRELEKFTLLLLSQQQLLAPGNASRSVLADLEQGLTLCRESGDRLGELYFLNLVWPLQQSLQSPREVAEVLERRTQLFRELGFRRSECSSLLLTAMSYVRQGEPRRALGPCERALAIAEELGDPHLELEALRISGVVHMGAQDLERGSEFMTRAGRLQGQLEENSKDGGELTELLSKSKFDFAYMKRFAPQLTRSEPSEEQVMPSFLTRFQSPLMFQGKDRYAERQVALRAFLQKEEV